MAIFDGLKNGYSQYFMPQVSQGINPQIMAYALQGSRGTRRSSGSSSGDGDTELKGLTGQVYEHHQRAAGISGLRSAARERFKQAAIENDFQNITSLPEYKDLVSVEQKAVQLEAIQKTNESSIESNQEARDKAEADFRRTNTLNNIALMPSGTFPGVGGTGLTPVAYKEVNGKKEMVNPFIRDEQGNVVRNKDIDGYMTNQDFLVFQDQNLGFDEKGLARRFQSPINYQMGQLDDKIHRDLTAAASNLKSKSIETPITNPTTEEQMMQTQEFSTNFQNLLNTAKSSIADITDQNIQGELLNEYINAVEADTRYYIPERDEDGNVSMKKKAVGDMSVEEYLASKNLNKAYDLVDTTEKRGLSAMPGGSDKGGLDKEKYEATVQSPQLHAMGNQVPLLTPSPTISGNTQTFKNKADLDRDEVFNIPSYVMTWGNEIRDNWNSVIWKGSNVRPDNIERLELAKDVGEFNSGIVLEPGGVVLDPKDYTNLRVVNYTGRTVMREKKQMGKDGVMTDQPQIAYDENGKPLKIDYKSLNRQTVSSYDVVPDIYKEVLIYVEGEDLEKVKVPIVDHKGNLEWRNLNKQVGKDDTYGDIYLTRVKNGNLDEEFSPKGQIKSGDRWGYIVRGYIPANPYDVMEQSTKPSDYNRDLRLRQGSLGQAMEYRKSQVRAALSQIQSQ